MARIRVEDVHKTYPNGHVAVRGIHLAIEDGELMVLVGASGCGKSTTLRMIAGLETPTRGAIWIGDRDVTRVRVQDRDVAMVFQSYALYPHKTVRQNLAFALEVRKASRKAVDERTAEVARALGLVELLDRKPAELSGGQRQRVALGRAIVREPQAFLFDEPLSNLDARLREQTRTELSRLHRRLGATMVYVTHDQEEAMTLGDRIAVLHEGRLQQCAPPLEVYRRPANAFVAGFVGNPAMNFLQARLQGAGGELRVTGPGYAVRIDPAGVHDGDQQVQLGIRPQDVEVVAPDDATADLVAAVDVIEPLGSEALVHVIVPAAAGNGDFRVITAPDVATVGMPLGLRLRRDRLHLFAPGALGARRN